MAIQIIESSSFPTAVGIYNSVRLQCDGLECTILKVTGRMNYVNVIIHNASHKAYRGNGKDFASIEEAKAHYKSPKIKAMLEFML
jgi:hypothetical protein